MTGARYGGAQYGGFRWSSTGRRAVIDGVRVRITELELAPQSITITGQVTRQRLDALETTVGRRAGRYRTQQQAGGQFRAEPTDGTELLDLTLPATVCPPEPTTQTVAVEGFDVQETAPEWRDVSLTLRRSAAPSTTSVTVVATGDDWTLDIGGHTSLSLPSDAVGQVSRQGSGGTDPTLQLAVDLAVEEAHALRQAGLIGGVVTRTVPDGQAFVKDATTNDHQTATVGTPAAASVDGGDYAVRSWSLRWRDGARRPWTATLRLDPL